MNITITPTKLREEITPPPSAEGMSGGFAGGGSRTAIFRLLERGGLL